MLKRRTEYDRLQRGSVLLYVLRHFIFHDMYNSGETRTIYGLLINEHNTQHALPLLLLFLLCPLLLFPSFFFIIMMCMIMFTYTNTGSGVIAVQSTSIIFSL